MADQKTNPELEPSEALKMTSDIVSAYLSNNTLDPERIPEVVKSVHSALGTLGQPEQPAAGAPAVPIKKSITPEYLVCLEDGKKLKMLKRYLRSQYGMTPEEYRKRWGLPADYPMVAPSYAERRSQFAKKIGLGRAAKKTTAKRPGRPRKKS